MKPACYLILCVLLSGCCIPDKPGEKTITDAGYFAECWGPMYNNPNKSTKP